MLMLALSFAKIRPTRDLWRFVGMRGVARTDRSPLTICSVEAAARAGARAWLARLAKRDRAATGSGGQAGSKQTGTGGATGGPGGSGQGGTGNEHRRRERRGHGRRNGIRRQSGNGGGASGGASAGTASVRRDRRRGPQPAFGQPFGLVGMPLRRRPDQRGRPDRDGGHFAGVVFCSFLAHDDGSCTSSTGASLSCAFGRSRIIVMARGLAGHHGDRGRGLKETLEDPLSEGMAWSSKQIIVNSSWKPSAGNWHVDSAALFAGVRPARRRLQRKRSTLATIGRTAYCRSTSAIRSFSSTTALTITGSGEYGVLLANGRGLSTRRNHRKRGLRLAGHRDKRGRLSGIWSPLLEPAASRTCRIRSRAPARRSPGRPAATS